MPLSERELDTVATKVFEKLKSLFTEEFVEKRAFEEYQRKTDERLQKLEDSQKELDDEIAKLRTANEELVKENSTYALKINNIKWRLEDRTNRDLRNNMVFAGVGENERYNTWSSTKWMLGSLIAKKCNMKKREARAMIERAHRGKKVPGKTPPIFCRFKFWEDAEMVKSAFDESVKQKTQQGVYCNKQFGPDTTEQGF